MIEILLEAERALTVGMVDRAEQLYRQAAAADPHNSIAVVGLARVALERADEEAAVSLARQALGIDAQNEAARRMVARLEEVRAHREAAAPPTPTSSPTPSTPAPTPATIARPTRRRRPGLLRRLLGRG
jgi:thioredoxin-like negative regulator of GroEL